MNYTQSITIHVTWTDADIAEALENYDDYNVADHADAVNEAAACGCNLSDYMDEGPMVSSYNLDEQIYLEWIIDNRINTGS